MDNALHIADKTILKWVFDTYYTSLVLYSKGIIHSEAACEDLVQETFINLYKNQNKFENEVALRTFLYKTARNKCLNIIKHEKVKANYAKKIMNESDEAYYDDLETETETVRLLKEAIEHLSERRRQIMELYIQGLKNPEIAKKLNLQIQTVKNIKYQAYQDIKKFFENYRTND